MPLLWEKSAKPSTTDAASVNVTSELPNKDGRTNGSASNQSNGIPSKDTTETSTLQENGEKTTENGKFSLKEDEERKPTFYSNAERAVENIKQNKATAEQWLAMLKKGSLTLNGNCFNYGWPLCRKVYGNCFLFLDFIKVKMFSKVSFFLAYIVRI